jgi:poly[(R)-3-hydroxyalkanoate] polymerase subunit PhaE
MECKFLELVKAWTEVRTISLQHGTHVMEAWAKAAEEFAAKLNQATAKGSLPSSRSDLVAMWVDIANQHLLEMQRSPPYLETQRKLLQASTDLRLVQQEIGDFYSEFFGIPTRGEIDDLSRAVADLRRLYRNERRQRSLRSVEHKAGTERTKDAP